MCSYVNVKEKEPSASQSQVQGGRATHFEHLENKYNNKATEQLV